MEKRIYGSFEELYKSLRNKGAKVEHPTVVKKEKKVSKKEDTKKAETKKAKKK